MWTLGWQETMFIFLLALLIFGPKKLPELGKNLAKGLSEFRRASNDLKSTFDREMANIERETQDVKQDLQKYSSEMTNYDSYYENSYYDSGYDGTGNTTTQETSTVSASATQGAESSTQPEAALNGTVEAASNTVTAEESAPANGGSTQVASAETASGGLEAGKPVART